MAFSINTNNASMAALESLRSTNSELTKAQNAVSTGLSVGSAADNPAIYAISQQMDGNISGLAAVSTSLSFGAQVVSTASSAVTNILSTLQTLQNTVTQAGSSGIDLSTMQTQVANALNQINTCARDSTFNGVNLLTSQTDAAGATSNSLAVVTGLTGTTLSITNQASQLNSTAKTLTDALGLTSGMAAENGQVIANGTASTGQVVQEVLTGNSGGLNISLNSQLTISSFSSRAC
jgi:flagellin